MRRDRVDDAHLTVKHVDARAYIQVARPSRVVQGLGRVLGGYAHHLRHPVGALVLTGSTEHEIIHRAAELDAQYLLEPIEGIAALQPFARRASLRRKPPSSIRSGSPSSASAAASRGRVARRALAQIGRAHV